VRSAGEQGVRHDVRIPVGGDEVAAWYLVPGPGVRPCVIMAHGFAGVRDDRGLLGFAEAFAAAGLAVVLFDYRHFGDSGGAPRQLLDIPRQQEDWRAVVAWARARPDVDADRVCLWGTSFSGGHVQQLAAGDPRVAAVVCQNPFCDGRSGAAGDLWLSARLAVVAARDRAAAALGLPPHYVAVLGHPGDLAVLTSDGAMAGDLGSLPPDHSWQNRVAARVLLDALRWRPGTLAGDIRCPVRYDVADADSVTPAGPAIEAAGRAPLAEVRLYPVQHFEFYEPPWQDRVAAGQVDFLARHLGLDARRPVAVAR
jgi:fermentation-respiration switch protein FrsA (DUF1100 family)